MSKDVSYVFNGGEGREMLTPRLDLRIVLADDITHETEIVVSLMSYLLG